MSWHGAYTDLSYGRFEEFQVVLKAVPAGSVVRLTLRAQPEVDLRPLEERLTEDMLNRLRKEVETKFEEQFSKVLPHPVAGALATPEDYARMVQLMIRRAASVALDQPGSERDFLPVHSMRYDDHTQMLSVTGVVVNRQEIAEMREKLNAVRFANFDWAVPDQINIPALSAKERHKLEKLLPIENGNEAGAVLFTELGYFIDNSEAATKRQLAQYADYHREYPQFVRIAV